MSPKGLTSARCALSGTTSSAVRSVALWFGAHRLALVYSLLKAFCFRCLFSYLFIFRPVGLSFVITLFINICLFIVSVVSVLCDEWN